MLTAKRAGVMAAVGIALVMAVVVTGVGSAAQSQPRANSGYKIFIMPQIVGIPYTNFHKVGAAKAAKELGDTITYTGPTTISPTQQVAFINTAVRQGYDAIVVGADDPNAIVPALKRAQAKGVKVITFGADVKDASARTVFVSPPSYKDVGYGEVEWLGPQINYTGEIAILSATTTKLDQNTWIKYMKELLATPKYKNMKLVKIAYGNDDDTLSAQQTQALIQAYPNLKGIISPTAVGLPAAARVLSQEGKCPGIALTGIALPSAMKTYVKSGCVKKFGLWDPIDLGYLATYVAHNVLTGKLTDKVGGSVVAGHMGKKSVIKGPFGPTILVGRPLVFTKANIDKFGF